MHGAPASGWIRMDTVLSARQGATEIITLNRPERLNAFNEEMHAALAAALGRVEADRNVRAVVLTGAGRGFSAGQDLSDRMLGEGDAPPDLGDTLERLYNPLVRRMKALPAPTIAAINGAAAGASLNVALACDVVIAGERASFLEPFANLGLVPDAGGTFVLPRIVGSVRARAMMMLAEKVDAQTAAQWGLVYKVVPDDALMAHALQIAERLSHLPTDGLFAMRRLIDAGTSATLDEQLDAERDAQRALGRGADYAEGVRAFMEKRKPQFGERS